MDAIEKELRQIEKLEARICIQYGKKPDAKWKEKLEEKIPDKVLDSLRRAFSKAFYLVFEKGTVFIEKTYNKDLLEKDFMVNDYAVDIKGKRKEIKKLRKSVQRGNQINALLTAAEGIGLGALGIGIPDIVLWVGMLLKGVYETALKYGFDYDTPEEKMFILTMLEAAMNSKENWLSANKAVDNYIQENTHIIPSEEELKSQIEKTADAFAADLLAIKFIQGFPIVGMIGGLGNSIYYQKIMKYVQLKYRKRYLILKISK